MAAQSIVIFLLAQLCLGLYPFYPAQYFHQGDIASFCGSITGTTAGAFPYYGNTYTTYRVNVNGLLNFGSTCTENAYFTFGIGSLNTSPLIATYVEAVSFEGAAGNPAPGVYFGSRSGPSPIDNIIANTNRAAFVAAEYILVTWYKVPANGATNLYNTYQLVIATDRTSTYVCNYYPGAEDSENANGGCEWGCGFSDGISCDVYYATIGFYGDNTHFYSHPDSKTMRILSLDGVPNSGSPPPVGIPTIYPNQYCYEVSGNSIFALPPTPNITFPASGESVTNTVQIVISNLLPSTSVTVTITGGGRSPLVLQLTSNSAHVASTVQDISSFLDGAITITAAATVSIGNWQSSVIVNKDTIFPVVSITEPTTGTRFTGTQLGSVVFSGTSDTSTGSTLTISDGVTTITLHPAVSSGGSWSITNSISSLKDGTLRVTYTATDSSGLTGTAQINIFKDSAFVTLTSPVNNQLVGSSQQSNLQISGTGVVGARVFITVTDSAGNSIQVNTIVTNAQTWNVNANVQSLLDGSLRVTARIISRLGTTVSATVNIVKDTGTFVTITTPTDGSTVNQVASTALTIGGSGEAFSVVFVTISDSSSTTTNIVTGTTQVSSSGSWSISVDISSQADGQIRLIASSTDPSGNTAVSPTVTLNKDTTVAIAIFTPTNQQFVVTQARVNTLTIQGYGDYGATVVVTISDSNSATPNVVSSPIIISSVGTFGVTLSVSTLNDGLLSIVATATDNVGNVVNSPVVSLTKDTFVFASITSPTTGTIINSALENLVIYGTGEAGGRISLKITFGTNGTITKSVTIANDGSWSASIPNSSLPIGTINIGGTANDVAGNTANLSSVSITKVQ